ncbi:GRIP1-associated protein 1-like [Glandiceps talaboti]
MAQSLSDEEFQRMQDHLLELRTANYQLVDDNKRQSLELSTLRSTATSYEKELQKANKAISKSKKAHEYEILLSENEHLQMKMVSQEDDFKLQNSTMMQELSLLYDKNEKLEREMKKKEEGQEMDHQAEIRRLQATNSALQNRLGEIQNLYQSAVRENKDNELGHSIDEQDGLEPGSSNSKGSSVSQIEETCNKVELQMQELNELRLRADTEREENKMLKEQLGSLEQQYQSELLHTREELAKLQEKVKKKQESFLQLQNAKDTLYMQNQKQIEEMKDSYEKELQTLIEQNGRIQAELTTTSQSLDAYQDQQQCKIQELESIIEALQEQSIHSSLSEEMQKLQSINNGLVVEKEDLQFQLTEAISSNSQLMEQVQQTQAEKDTVLQDMNEINKVAEKRKSMLDEMAIQVQTTKQQHMEQINSIQDNNKKEQDSLREQLQQEKKEKKELEVFRDKVPELENQISSLESTKGWFERRLEETEEILKQSNEKHVKSREELETRHNNELEEERNKLIEKETEIHTLQEEIELKAKTVEDVKQEIKDMVEEKKIAEKKKVSMVKDLKRQLHLERKRGEKLQERLQEILSENSGMKSSVDELFQQYNAEERYKGDSSSVSSWAASMKDATTDLNQSNASENSTTSAALNEETNELLSRIAELQEEKWSLEERVCLKSFCYLIFLMLTSTL